MIWTRIALCAGLLTSPALSTPPGGGVEWEFGPIAAALAKAKTQDKLCLIYFWADGSEFSGKLYKETLTNDKTAPILDKMVCYSAKHGSDTAELFERFRIKTLPTMMFVNGDGQPEDIISGFIPPEDFVGECDRILRAEGTVSGLRAGVAEAKGSPDEMKLRWLLAGKLLDVFDEEGHDRNMNYIREHDPDGETEIGAKLLLSEVVKQVVSGGDKEWVKAKGKGKSEESEGEEEEGDGKADASSWDLTPVYALAKTLKPQKVRFEAWNRVANLEAHRGELTEACKAFAQARKLLSDEASMDWHRDVANWIVEYQEEMTSKERKLALEYALTADKLARVEAKRIAKEAEEAEQTEEGGDSMCAVDPDKMRAPYLQTLALAYHVNRKKAKAVAIAEECVKLDATEAHRKTLSKVRVGLQ